MARRTKPSTAPPRKPQDGGAVVLSGSGVQGPAGPKGERAGVSLEVDRPLVILVDSRAIVDVARRCAGRPREVRHCAAQVQPGDRCGAGRAGRRRAPGRGLRGAGRRRGAGVPRARHGRARGPGTGCRRGARRRAPDARGAGADAAPLSGGRVGPRCTATLCGSTASSRHGSTTRCPARTSRAISGPVNSTAAPPPARALPRATRPRSARRCATSRRPRSTRSPARTRTRPGRCRRARGVAASAPPRRTRRGRATTPRPAARCPAREEAWCDALDGARDRRERGTVAPPREPQRRAHASRDLAQPVPQIDQRRAEHLRRHKAGGRLADAGTSHDSDSHHPPPSHLRRAPRRAGTP